MIHAISNLQRLSIERKKAVIAGETGQVELAVYGPGMISVFYVMEGQSVRREAGALHAALFSDRFVDPTGARMEWESIRETENDFELRYASLRVRVDKGTATLSVYDGERLVHGGRIGDRDTVLPSHPLRVQQDVAGSISGGKFNFRLEEGDAFFGLGEKSGLLNKRNRSFKLFNRDALGYDAGFSDPLYKSVPFFVKINRARGVACGLYFPNLRVDEVNFGVESEFYYHVGLGGGPFGYFLISGSGYGDVLSNYADLCGKPALPPLFSFGYLASSMAYTDPDDAMERILGYFERVEGEGIPCEGMYFSSGYAKADNGERYTFVWNRRKFPEPRAFLEELGGRGYRVCCNIKPGILTTHPWYPELARRGVFVSDASGEPFVGYYWGNSASFVDFAKTEGYAWWMEALTRNIIEQGAMGAWNDNNEFELEDESLPAQSYRNILPVLMAKASFEALRRARPGKRPWVISRAGYAGLQRYARTWTGDNVSDFESLRFNIAMGLNLGMSGIPIYGHDIGGFFGPTPDSELLVRWCQSAVFQPRFVMHSWKPDGNPTEPWMYPESAGVIADLIRERYRFLPYIYDLAIRAAESGMPMETSLALDFPGDPELSFDSLDRMAGGAILVPAPPERGQSAIGLRLPQGTHWYDPVGERVEEGGRSLSIDWPLRGARYLLRCGTVVPTNPRADAVRTPGFPELLFLVTPPAGGPPLVSRHVEDDGESDYVPGSHLSYLFTFTKVGEALFGLEARLEVRAQVPRGFARTWRFRVPRGFVIEEGNGGQASSETRVEFSELPEALTFTLRGEYP